MEAALDQAMHEIYLESYIFENDNTGKRIVEALKRAAFRGVKTHLLIDGFGSIGLPKTIIDDFEAAGVMVLKFRPKTSPWTLRRRRLRRLHRKIVVVDREIAFVGGINIVDDMGMANQTSPRYDYAVGVEGPLVGEIHASTRRVWSRVAWRRMRNYWNRDVGGHSSSIEPRGRMRSAFLVRDNIRHRRDIEDAYLQAIEQARFEIILASAYFLPGLNFRHALLDDENFAKKLKHSLEQAIKMGARRILQNHWRTQPIRLRLASWLSYNLVRFMVGMTGYAPGK